MPKQPRLAFSHSNLPPGEPPPLRIAYRLALVMSSTFLSSEVLILTERSNPKYGEHVKLPQFAYLQYAAEQHGRLDDITQGIVMQKATAILTDPHIYNLRPDQVEISLHGKFVRLEEEDMSEEARIKLNADVIDYIVVHVRLLERIPHLENLDLQQWRTPAGFLAQCQSFRKKVYTKFLQLFSLHTNVISLPRR